MKYYLILITTLLGLVACSEGEQAQAPKSEASVVQTEIENGLTATVLLFQEREMGVPPYGSRFIVTKEFLRIDDGNDQGDFLLYDRSTRNVFSVTHQDQTVFEIDYHPVEIEPPVKLDLVTKSEVDEDAPSIGGQRPVHTTFSINSKRCFDVVSVPDVLEDEARALGEYATTLSGEQARNLHKTPVEFQDPCMLSNLIFHTEEHTRAGFPIQEWSYSGYSRELMDYRKDYPVSDQLFMVPPDYKRYKLDAQNEPTSASEQGEDRKS
jgi:hypothetical protein